MVNKRTGKSRKNASTLNRRALFAQGVAVAVGAGAATRAGTGAAVAQQAAPAAITWDHETDVLVCGAGNGGMSAALAAADRGAKTLVLEISTQIGGNTLMSGGVMHTMGQRNWEDYNRATNGQHDQFLAKVYVEAFWNEYVPWLQSHNAYMSRPSPNELGALADWWLGNGEPGQLRHKLYFDSLVTAFERFGGTIQRKTRVTSSTPTTGAES